MRVYRSAAGAAFLFAAVSAADAQTFGAAGVDEVNVTVQLQLFDDTACTVASGPQRSPLGVLKVKHGTPIDPGDGRDEVPLEILSLSIADGSLSIVEAPGGSDPDDLGDPPCTGGAASADGGSGCSPGLIKASQAAPDLPATFALDWYFQLTDGGATLFNKTGAGLVDGMSIAELPFPYSAAYFGDLTCIPLYDVADPSGPAVRSLRTFGFVAGPHTAEPATALRLVILDKPGASGKVVFKSLDPHVFGQCDPTQLTMDLFISYDAAAGSYSVPAGPFDGVAGWTQKPLPPPATGYTCRYRNKAAPGGATEVKAVKTGPLKIVASGLGDVPIDLFGVGPPSGTVKVKVHAAAAEARVTLCTEFVDCTYALIGDGTGAKLKCTNGTPDTSCVPIE